MLEIKTLSDLDKIQRQEIFQFVYSFNQTYQTLLEFENYYQAKHFNNGETTFCFFLEDLPVGILAVVTKEIFKGKIFITGVNIKTKDNLIPIINLTFRKLSFLKPEIIKIGINPNKKHFITLLENIGFKNPYKLFLMEYKKEIEPFTENNNFSLTPLNTDNKLIFKNILNDSFRNSPNGGYLLDEDLETFLNDYRDTPDLVGIFNFNHIAIGTYELKVEKNIGYIESIGISSEYQGKGYGKKILEKVIDKLLEYNVEQILLTVVETNTIAYIMYDKYGFKIKKTLAIWMEKSKIM